MTISDLRSMTVVQLRKFAKENGIVLSAGMDKASIVDAVAQKLNISDAEDAQAFPVKSEPVPASSVSESEASETEDKSPALSPDGGLQSPSVKENMPQDEAVTDPAENPASFSEPKYQAAWHSPDAPQKNAHAATYVSTGAGHPAWQNTSPSGRPLSAEQRPQPLRPRTFGPRFGPTSVRPEIQEQNASQDQDVEVSRSAAPSVPEHRAAAPSNPVFGPRAVSPSPTPVVTVPAQAAVEADDMPLLDSAASAPTLEELLETGDFEEGGGILELHPDGYGFLRASNFTPSSKDIYVSMAQIRRFSLRTGDLIQGKIRPQREGDKYAALLYIDTVNGLTEDEALQRPFFDELTPVYPYRRISLESKSGKSLTDMRLIDLIAPLGFGQRGLILCPPETGKRELLQHYANTITENYPEVTVLTLLVDLTPEDVTEFRESVSCPVLASTFDQPPEAHLRLTEMVVERAMRLVEQKKDVVILADSLTRLAKIYSTSAVQQGRSVPGMVNPASLLRTKRLFGSARAMKEGGSLTVIATMDIASGNKVDDSVVEEFKGTANMELMLDQSLVRDGIEPAINLQRSFTKNSDILLNDQEKEGLNLIRQMLGTTPSSVAIPQLVSMMEKTDTNSELLLKMKDWFALMNM